MNEKQLKALTLRDTDVDGAMRRLCGSEELYNACFQAFLEDRTVEELNRALKQEAWDGAFTAAHALKGVAGNMGFVPLMHRASQLIVLIRGGRTQEIPVVLEQVNSAYRDIMDGIRQYLEFAEASEPAAEARAEGQRNAL